jgi:hypothetical protein
MVFLPEGGEDSSQFGRILSVHKQLKIELASVGSDGDLLLPIPFRAKVTRKRGILCQLMTIPTCNISRHRQTTAVGIAVPECPTN